MSSKYLELDSTFRNRNEYPNPCDFILPIKLSINNNQKYIDPIIEGVEFSGSKNKPGLNFTRNGSTSTLIYLDNNEPIIDNYYVNSLLGINNEYSKILYYDGTNKTALIDVPFSSTPIGNTQYFTRKSTPYFSSNILPYQPNVFTNSVSELQLLSLQASNIPQQYKGSFVRFINGGNTNVTTVIVTDYQINSSPGNPLTSSYSQPNVDLVNETSNEKIIETIPNIKFSWSLATSDNSEITISGAPNYNNGDGAVYVYTNLDNNLKQTLQASNLQNSGFGYSLAISSNANIIVVGAPNYDNNTGCVVVFKRINDVYVEFSRILSTISGSYFGYYVSINIDGSLIAISSPYSDQVFIYKLTNSTNSTNYLLQATLMSTLIEPNSNFGSVTSMDSNGIFLAITAPFDNNGRGSVNIFKRTQNNWIQTSRLSGFTSTVGLSMSSDSNFIAVGDPSYLTTTGGSGGVWLFRRSGNLWSQSGNIIIASGSIGEYIGQGISVGLSRDARNLIVGAPGDDSNVGAAFLYTLVNGNVISVIKVVGDGGITSQTSQGQGDVVSISGDGNNYFSGNSTDNNDQGAFWSFRQNATSVTNEQGFVIYPQIDGYLVSFSINMKSTNLEDDVVVRFRQGSGLNGQIIYEKTFTINLSMSRQDYVFNTFDSIPLENNKPYTLTIYDLNPSGNSAITMYGIYNTQQYVSFGTSIYPKLQTFQRPAITTRVITVNPSLPINNFLGNGLDIIEFNSFTRENANGLYVYDIQQYNSSESFYEIELIEIILPKQIMNSWYGGYIENYPYFYVELYNESASGNTNTLASMNPTSILALFKIPVTKKGTVSNFYTFKNVQSTQIIKLRLDQYLRFKIKLGNGEVISWQNFDNLSPLPPNQFLQTTVLFRLSRLQKNK